MTPTPFVPPTPTPFPTVNPALYDLNLPEFSAWDYTDNGIYMWQQVDNFFSPAGGVNFIQGIAILLLLAIGVALIIRNIQRLMKKLRGGA